jgi:hypothetical protein
MKQLTLAQQGEFQRYTKKIRREQFLEEMDSVCAPKCGEVDLYATPRVSFRMVRADYLTTTFENGSNDRENNLRLSAGLVVRFGKR